MVRSAAALELDETSLRLDGVAIDLRGGCDGLRDALAAQGASKVELSVDERLPYTSVVGVLDCLAPDVEVMLTVKP